jgi:transposase
MLKSTIFGIDLAKNIIQVCQISKHGELVSNKAVSRQKLKELLATVKPAVVAIEGCGSSHYWGRYAEQFGHDVHLFGRGVFGSLSALLNFCRLNQDLR